MEFLGKKVKLLFDDLGRPTTKQGILLDLTANYAKIETGKTAEIIPLSRIIRIELLEDSDA